MDFEDTQLIAWNNVRPMTSFSCRTTWRYGGTQVAKYVYGAGLDEPIRMYRSSTNYYYFTDGLGNITEVTDGSGNLIEQYSYIVFGRPIFRDRNGAELAASAINNRWLFQGRDWDAGQQLYNYRFRWYSPTLGRFMQTDPLRWQKADAIGDCAGLNLYQFDGSNPINSVDPYGLYDPNASFFPENCIPFINYGIGTINNTTSSTFPAKGSIGKSGSCDWLKIRPGRCGGKFPLTGPKGTNYHDIDYIYPSITQPINGKTSGMFKIGANNAILSVDARNTNQFILKNYNKYIPDP